MHRFLSGRASDGKDEETLTSGESEPLSTSCESVHVAYVVKKCPIVDLTKDDSDVSNEVTAKACLPPLLQRAEKEVVTTSEAGLGNGTNVMTLRRRHKKVPDM